MGYLIMVFFAGTVSGFYLSKSLNIKTKNDVGCDFKDGLPKPKNYPAMPPIQEQVPPKAPPTAPVPPQLQSSRHNFL